MSGFGSIVLALLALGCGEVRSDGRESRRVTAVRVETLSLATVTPTLSVPGLVEANSRIELSFRVGGYVKHIHVDEGDRVGRDQILAELDQEVLEREVRTVRAIVEQSRIRALEARNDFERQSQLREKGSSSEQTFHAARAAHQMAEAEIDEARLRLEQAENTLARATLRAPWAGHIERRLVEEHERAAAHSPVFVLSDLDSVVVRAAVAEVHLPRLLLNADARVFTVLHADTPFSGTITNIDLAADESTRMVHFEVTVENPALILRPELPVELVVTLGAPERHLLVPLSAVLHGADRKPFCFVIEQEGENEIASRRSVLLGAVHDARVAVLGGLAAGDSLVVRGQHFLRPGDAVHVVKDGS